MAEPVRTCIVTRQEGGPKDLLRLVALDDGRVVVDRSGKLPGRGAWITPSRAVFAQLEKKPGLLLRALQLEGVNPEQAGVRGLLAEAQAVTDAAILDLLSLAARSGRLASGAEQVAAAVREEGGVAGLVVAADASPQSVEAAKGARELPVWTLALTRDELGRRIGKGPRAVLALRTGGPTDALVRQLRRRDDLR